MKTPPGKPSVCPSLLGLPWSRQEAGGRTLELGLARTDPTQTRELLGRRLARQRCLLLAQHSAACPSSWRGSPAWRCAQRDICKLVLCRGGYSPSDCGRVCPAGVHDAPVDGGVSPRPLLRQLHLLPLVLGVGHRAVILAHLTGCSIKHHLRGLLP